MSAEVSDTIFSQVMMRAIQPKASSYKLLIPSLTVFKKINISSLRMCFRAGALSGGKYVSNSEYDRHGDTCSCVPLMKEGKITMSK